MKFGSQLKDAIYPEWTPFYLDYDGLKKKLRKAEKERPFTDKDETEFVELLDNNLEKVNNTKKGEGGNRGVSLVFFFYILLTRKR
jgi:SPX domain protein involved in polyphosphate accumulation